MGRKTKEKAPMTLAEMERKIDRWVRSRKGKKALKKAEKAGAKAAAKIMADARVDHSKLHVPVTSPRYPVVRGKKGMNKAVRKRKPWLLEKDPDGKVFFTMGPLPKDAQAYLDRLREAEENPDMNIKLGAAA